MKRTIYITLAGSTLALTVAAISSYFTLRAPTPAGQRIGLPESGRGQEAEEMDQRLRQEWELKRLRDPRTGVIPFDARRRELAFAQTLPGSLGRMPFFKGAQVDYTWSSRGPYNVGGRTRAFAIDVADPRIMLAGGVTGGIWRNNNNGGGWIRTTRPDQFPSVTCLVQDTRPGKTRTWYYGTGEYRTNSTRFGNVLYAGDGIFKSTDNGLTWTQLPSTVTAAPHRPDQPFSFVNAIVVDTTRAGSDVVYAAVLGGIMRSADGGTTWTRVLGDAGSQVGYTDMTQAADGTLYASISSGGSTYGIFRSKDGTSWTEITPQNWGDSTRRVVLATAPSNPNIVYFLAETPGRGHQVPGSYGFDEFYSLWKYTYVSGDGTGQGGVWLDRSENLPHILEPWIYNGLNSYAMMIRVKPNDPNTVYIGGSSLWRSSDGFATADGVKWMGGYDQDGSWGMEGSLHPDVHSLLFSPENPDMVYVTGDGGIYSAMPGANFDGKGWSPRNYSYVTTQFYSVAVDHESPGSQMVIGGAQDNGSYVSMQSSKDDQWPMLMGGDGSFCAVADRGRVVYVSSQFGNIIREELDESGFLTNYDFVGPAENYPLLFVTPFLLDPSGNNTLYMACRGGVLRNLDASVVGAASQWSIMPGTGNPNIEVSALGMSRAGSGNRLYYGTSNGRLFRVDNAATADEPATEITGADFPLDAYINCVAVDPADADRALVVFSNYNVVSLYLTTDAGGTWTPVAGNLEESADGSGAGPSCRWASILHHGPSTIYLVGTSTGLYSTTRIDGPSTTWRQEGATTIGNVIVDMIDARQSDGMVAVASWGLGVFTATIDVLGAAPADAKAASAARLLLGNSPNPVRGRTTIDVMIPGDVEREVELLLFDATGRPAATIARRRMSPGRHAVPFDADRPGGAPLPAGTYFYRVRVGEATDTRSMTIVR